MRRTLAIASFVFFLPIAAMAELPVPMVVLGGDDEAPLLTTWAHASGKAVIRIESPESLALICDIYQLDGRSVIPISREMTLDELKRGANRLEIPLPETSKRGKLLFKISTSTKDKLIANLMVDILSKDALESLVNQSKQGRVWIDPKLKDFTAWAVSHGISSTAPTSEKPAEFYFSKPIGNSNPPPLGRVLIFERDQPEAFPVIEVITIPEVTKILTPSGFLSDVPHSATAQALLLKYLKLLP